MATKSCGHCGVPVDDDGGFCSSCGKRLVPAPTAVDIHIDQPCVSRKVFISTVVVMTMGGIALGFLAGGQFEQRLARQMVPIAKNTTNISSTPSGGSSGIVPTPPKDPASGIIVENNTSSRTARSDNFELTINDCAHNGSAMNCQLLITNLAEDRGVEFNRGCARIIDGDGNEFLVQRFRLGHDTAGEVGTWINMKLIAGIPMKLELDFGEQSTKARSIRLLQVVFNSAGRKHNLKFRDVPFSRRRI